MEVKFMDAEHEANYLRYLYRMRSRDVYHRCAAYLMALDILRGDAERLFDFENDSIRPQALEEAWQTHGTLRATKLMFNLWNGWSNDAEYDEHGRFESCGDLVPGYTPAELFGTSYDEVFFEAIRIRFHS